MTSAKDKRTGSCDFLRGDCLGKQGLSALLLYASIAQKETNSVFHVQSHPPKDVYLVSMIGY